MQVHNIAAIGLTGDAITYSPDGKSIAVAGTSANGSGFVQVWSLSSGSLSETLDSTSNSGVYGLAFSPDGTKIADSGWIVSKDKATVGVVELWNVAKGELTSRFPTRSAMVNTIAFTPNGDTLAVGGLTQASAGSVTLGSLELWSVVTNKQTVPRKPCRCSTP